MIDCRCHHERDGQHMTLEMWSYSSRSLLVGVIVHCTIILGVLRVCDEGWSIRPLMPPRTQWPSDLDKELFLVLLATACLLSSCHQLLRWLRRLMT